MKSKISICFLSIVVILLALVMIEKINTQTLWMSNGQCIPIPKGKYRLLSKAFIAHHFKEAM